MKVAETSLEAYLGLDLTQSQEQVLEVIKDYGPITQEEVADRLGKYPHQVSGRFGELQELNQIEIVGHTENQHGNKVRRYDIQ